MFSLRNRQRMTVVLWLLLFVVAVYWARQRNLTVDARGVAHATVITVSSEEAAPLAQISVDLHDPVQPEQALARLDAGALLQEQRVATAEWEAIRQEESERERSSERVFDRDREDASMEAARLRMQVREDEARLSSLLQELELNRDLAEQGLLPAQQAGEVEREITVVQSRLAATRDALEVAEESRLTAQRRRAKSPVANDWAMIAAGRRVEWLDERLTRLEITSPVEGQVTWIHKRTGDFVRPGEPILDVSPLHTEEVHAYVSGTTIKSVNPGDRARVDRLTGERLWGEVLSVGGDLRQMPPNLWRNPVAAEWGFLVRIAVPGAQLSPGEYLQIIVQRSS